MKYSAVHNLITSDSGQVCEDLPVCGCVHVLPHQHGHRCGQIQVHRQVPVPAGGNTGHLVWIPPVCCRSPSSGPCWSSWPSRWCPAASPSPSCTRPSCSASSRWWWGLSLARCLSNQKLILTCQVSRYSIPEELPEEQGAPLQKIFLCIEVSRRNCMRQ